MQIDYIVLNPTTLRVTRKSPRTGVVNAMDIPATREQLELYAEGRELIQNCFPNANAEQREFIQTGYTPEDWAAIFPPEEDKG